MIFSIYKKAQHESKFLKFSLINGSTLEDLIRSCFLLKMFSINHFFFYVMDFQCTCQLDKAGKMKTKHGKKQDRADINYCLKLLESGLKVRVFIKN